jgi:glycosyltransferase involved in cell wall biosynthesis
VSAGPIRVLHTITGLRIGGAERLVVAATAGLPRARFESAVCCLAERGPLADEAERSGSPVWCIGEFPGLRHPLAFRRLVGTIASFRPHIVHTHLQSANLYGRLAAILTGVPIIVSTEHNVYASKPRRYIAVERMLARRTRALIAVSAEVRRSLAEQLRIDPRGIRLIHNGVPDRQPSPDRVRKLRARIPGLPGELVLGSVASLTPKKGLVFLIRALAMLAARGRPASLVVAGEGPNRQRLESLAAELGVSGRVLFLGDSRHVEDVFDAIEVFVLPSLVEGLPLALLEAMRAGKPVVATSVGGVPEVVTSDVNGLLVEPGNTEQLADAIELMARSPELRATLGSRARETVEREFTERQYLTTLASLYDELARSCL